MKYFVQVKFRKFQMTFKSKEFQKFFVRFFFQILHLCTHIFQNFQIYLNKFSKIINLRLIFSKTRN